MLEGVIEPQQKTASARSTPASGFGNTSSPTFEELFLVIYPRLVSLLRRILGDSGRAEELANETFLRLHNTVLPPAARANLPGYTELP